MQCPRRNLTTNLLLKTFWTLAKKKRKNIENEQRREKKSIDSLNTFLLFKELKKKMFSSKPTISNPNNNLSTNFSLFLKINGKNAKNSTKNSRRLHVPSKINKKTKINWTETSYKKASMQQKIFLKTTEKSTLKKNPLCFFLLISTLIVIVISFFVLKNNFFKNSMEHTLIIIIILIMILISTHSLYFL